VRGGVLVQTLRSIHVERSKASRSLEFKEHINRLLHFLAGDRRDLGVLRGSEEDLDLQTFATDSSTAKQRRHAVLIKSRAEN